MSHNHILGFGPPTGCSLQLISTWDPVVDRFEDKLAMEEKLLTFRKTRTGQWYQMYQHISISSEDLNQVAGGDICKHTSLGKEENMRYHGIKQEWVQKTEGDSDVGRISSALLS